MKEQMQEMLNDVLADKLVEGKEHFNKLMEDKLKLKLDEQRIEVAQALYNTIQED